MGENWFVGKWKKGGGEGDCRKRKLFKRYLEFVRIWEGKVMKKVIKRERERERD